jgi:predicted ribosomally synthesized peptide with SipW-like signal peptide
MKKLLASSTLLLGAMAALWIGSTGAFFSDVETSAGNTFTAGAIDLKIDNTSYYNGNVCANPASDQPDLGYIWVGQALFPVPGTPCTTTWLADDLNNGEITLHKFFDFIDLKPSDQSEDTISLHTQNDAYLCAEVKLTSNKDNDCTTPENAANGGENGACGAGDSNANGEIAQNVNFIWWADDGDNVLESNETVIPAGNLGQLGVGNTANVTLADSGSNIWTGQGGPIPGNTTKYIGKAWCFGNITANSETKIPQDGQGAVDANNDGIPDNGPDTRGGGFNCDGSGLDNKSQTDTMTADVTFEATQARNNSSFLCSGGHCPIGTQNILVPGYNFETPVVANAALWDVFSSPTGGWNVEWRDAGPTTFGPQTRPAIANLEYHRGVLGPAADGQQYVELDSDWGGPSDSGTGEPASVTIYQNITTIPGKQYEIHYAFAARPNTPAADNNLEFRWGGVVSDTTGPTAGTSSIAWTERVVTVTATTTSTRIQFTDLGTSNSVGTFLDNVRVFTESCVQS